MSRNENKSARRGRIGKKSWINRGDYNTRRIWGLRQADGVLVDVRELETAPGGIASCGLDDQGEILLVTYAGQIFHLDLSGTKYE